MWIKGFTFSEPDERSEYCVEDIISMLCVNTWVFKKIYICIGMRFRLKFNLKKTAMGVSIPVYMSNIKNFNLTINSIADTLNIAILLLNFIL